MSPLVLPGGGGTSQAGESSVGSGPVQTVDDWTLLDYAGSMGYDTVGQVSAFQFALPAGTYTGVTVPLDGAGYTADDDNLFVGVYSDDGTTLLARTADLAPTVAGTSGAQLVTAQFDDDLVLAVPTLVRVAALTANGDMTFGYMSPSAGWNYPLTTRDEVQTGLTDLPASIAVSVPDASLASGYIWAVRFEGEPRTSDGWELRGPQGIQGVQGSQGLPGADGDASGTIDALITAVALLDERAKVYEYDAADLVLSDGDPVGTWADSSGNAHDLLQATGGSKPLLKTAIVNGLPVVRFDGVNDRMAAAFAFAEPLTVFVVAKYSGALGGNGQVVIDSQSNQYEKSLARVTATRMEANDGTFPVNLYVETTPTNWHVYTVVFNSGASLLVVDDGDVTASGSMGPSASSGLTVGSRQGSGDEASVDVARIVGYTEALTATELRIVQKRLMHQYGIA